jgi:hypothetical protein
MIWTPGRIWRLYRVWRANKVMERWRRSPGYPGSQHRQPSLRLSVRSLPSKVSSRGGVQGEPGQQLRTFGGADLLAKLVCANAGFCEYLGLASPYSCGDLLPGPGDQRFKFGSKHSTDN